MPNLLRYMPIFILNSWHDSDVFFAVFHLLYPLFYTMLLESTVHLIRSHLFSQGNLRLEFQEIPTYFLASCFWLFLCIFAIIGNHASSFCLHSHRPGQEAHLHVVVLLSVPFFPADKIWLFFKKKIRITLLNSMKMADLLHY